MSFFATDLRVRMPKVGLIARNANNFQTGQEGWLNAEEQLCTEYQEYVQQISEAEFDQRIEYMNAARDTGRSPMSTIQVVLLFLLVVAEAAGFSYLLATWFARGGSQSAIEKLGYAIVVVLAFVLAWSTHHAGAQFYKTRLKRACFRRYKESHVENTHTTRNIKLSDDQFEDAEDLPARRTLNRITESDDDLGSYSWCWVALILVVALVGGSAFMRYSQLQTELNQESAALVGATGDPFKTTGDAPSELSVPQRAADAQASKEDRNYVEDEGLAAILVLSVIFFVTQIVGFSMGHKHCFAGRQTYYSGGGANGRWFLSAKTGAYVDTWGMATYQQYWNALAPVKATVNKRLKELQHLLVKNSRKNLELKNTFEDFLAREKQKEALIRAENNRASAAPTAAFAARAHTMVQQRTDARPRAIQPMPGPASHTAATSVFDSSGTWNGEIAKNRSSDDGEAFVPESARPMNPSLIARQQAAERRQAAASNVDSTAQDLSSAVERAKPGAPSKLKTPDQLI